MLEVATKDVDMLVAGHALLPMHVVDSAVRSLMSVRVPDRLGFLNSLVRAMTVSELIANEFAQTLPWPLCLDNRKSAPDAPAVYALWCENQFARLIGNSNVLYIGSTLRLGGGTDGSRLYSYRFSPQPHSRAMRERTQSLVQAGHTVLLRWIEIPSEEQARTKERELLALHLSEHLEYPPFNGKRA
jgi:hypothetical protein